MNLIFQFIQNIWNAFILVEYYSEHIRSVYTEMWNVGPTIIEMGYTNLIAYYVEIVDSVFQSMNWTFESSNRFL